MRRRCIRSDILVENCRYGAERSKVQLRQRAVFPKIMLLQEEANSIVTDTVLDSSEQQQKCFWQFIADNFDHNEDNTSEANTTLVMGMILSETPE